MRGLFTNWTYTEHNRLVFLTTKTVTKFPIHALLLLFASQKNSVIKRSLPKATITRKIVIRPVLGAKEIIYTTLYL